MISRARGKLKRYGGRKEGKDIWRERVGQRCVEEGRMKKIYRGRVEGREIWRGSGGQTDLEGEGEMWGSAVGPVAVVGGAAGDGAGGDTPPLPVA